MKPVTPCVKLIRSVVDDFCAVCPTVCVDQPSATVTLAIDQASASVTPSLHSIIDIHDPTAASNIVLLKPNVNVGCMSSSLSNRMQNSHTSKTGAHIMFCCSSSFVISG